VVDETPELPIPIEVEPTELPEPPSATPKSLVRDAVLDLGAALVSGLGLIVVGMIVAVIVLIATRSRLGMAAAVTSPFGIAGLLLATQLPLLFFALRRRRRNREKYLPLPVLFGGPAFPAIPLGVGMGLGMTILSALYTGVLQKLLGSDSVPNQVQFLQDLLDNKPAVAVLVFLIACLAPICEELFFRGMIFGSAQASGLSKVGMTISAVLFAIVHVSPLLAPFYACFAVAMCWLYARTGTLAAPMAAHATLNSVACAALLIAGGNRV